MRTCKSGLIALAIAAVCWTLSVAEAQDVVDIPLSHPAVRYEQATDDPVAVMLRQPATRARIDSSEPSRLLETLLDVLSIPRESQMFVFSKGSLQRARIDERNPRALYFNDAVAIGWVRGGFIEIASQDPTHGTVFYVAGASPRPFVVRRDDRCLSCHFTGRTDDVPGMIEPIGHKRLLEDRWGGWYVTGQLGTVRHFGNVPVAAFLRDPELRAVEPLSSLERTFDTSGYLTPHSDVVALLVFEHQMQMMNLLTRLGWETRVARHEGRLDATRSAIRDRVERVVDYMLFVDEAPIRSRIEGSTRFAALFSARGPRDRQGRSLYELDLETRLMRYPCSYMIYSKQFDQLPNEAKTAVYQRLREILSGAEQDVKYRHLSRNARDTIVEILRQTKPDLGGWGKWGG
jgi:hypothetical protein